MCVMGKLRYYGCFCEHFLSMAKPIERLLKKRAVFNFGAEQRAAMDSICTEIYKEGKALKRYDATLPVYLHVDFSNFGLGAVLSQTNSSGQEYMVACCSRSLNKHVQRRMFGCRVGMQDLPSFLAWSTFHHRHGSRAAQMADVQRYAGRSARTLGLHAARVYDFDIVHRPGVLNNNADAI